ncbi:DUF2500 domain-containing protein [Clostridium nigeriense]|uniref:DUF2500 domain-containing protein n=1 Tax=Clostridium nigeriense TaxID=1805470 RepID=UPI0008369805|nr:DUF2500 domain-containing protein [Clostridium nigeriense]
MYMFNLFSFIFPIFFIVFIGFFIFAIVKNIKEWSYNNKQPITPVEATIVSRRSSVSHHHHENHMSTSTTYYATFEFINGERLELRVSGREYGLLAEGDRGILSFQGTRFIDFKRK